LKTYVEALVSIGEDADLVRRFQLKEAVLEDRKLWSAPELDVGLRLHRARVRLDSGTDEAYREKWGQNLNNLSGFKVASPSYLSCYRLCSLPCTVEGRIVARRQIVMSAVVKILRVFLPDDFESVSRFLTLARVEPRVEDTSWTGD